MDNRDWMNDQLGTGNNETSVNDPVSGNLGNQGNTEQDVRTQMGGFNQENTTQMNSNFQQSNNHYQGQNGYIPYQTNQNNTYGAYTQSVQNQPKPEPKAKKAKKSGNGNGVYVVKKAAGIALAGVLFGAVAGGTFIGITQLQSVSNVVGSATQNSSQAVVDVAETEATLEEKAEEALKQSGEESGAKTQTVAVATTGNSVQNIASEGMKSIVAITNVGVTEIQTMWGKFSQESTSSGSGIIIGQTDAELLIVTNYHVVEGSSELTVVFSYDEASEEPNAVKAKIKGYDSERDLAVIAIPMENLTSAIMNEISVATVGDSSALELGEQVVAIGNALGYGQSVTVGYVSALDRVVELESEDGTVTANTFIQTDAAINPGNSGGALFNMQGELIGINSAKVSSSSVEGMGYAIPISEVTDIIGELMNSVTRDLVSDENRGYLGVMGRTVDSATSQAYGIPVGAYINEVTENSAAQKAGIQTGDIITKFDNKAVGTFENLQNMIRYYAAGETVPVTVMRQAAGGYQEVELSLTLCSAEEAGISDNSTNGSLNGDTYGNGGSQDDNNGYDDNYGYDDDYDYELNPFDFFFGN